jgi:Domain of unknown function (DUF4349)
VKKTLLILVLLTLACSKAARSAPETTDAVSLSKPPMIVRTAEMRILVADTAKTIDAVSRNVEAGGGYVASSNVWREGDVLRARITLRVPSAKLNATLASIRGLSRRVESESVSSEDVTQEYVDLDSQLRNLEATETELRELLKVARVNTRKASEVLEVHQQLTVIRGQIEQAKGRMRYLSQVTSFSAVNLEVVPDALAPGWQPSRAARDATRALVTLLQNAGTAAIWFVIVGLPVVGTLLLALAIVVRLMRRLRSVSAAAPDR